MAEFKAITTQEEFDEAIKARLARERATLTKEYDAKYADYEELKQRASEATSGAERDELQKKIDDLTQKVAAASAKIKGYELESLRRKVAAAEGVPAEFVSRLRGETEKEITEDAKALAGILEAQNRMNLPSYTSSRKTEDSKDAAFRQMAADIVKGA